MLLLGRVHQFAVGLVVPPHEAQVAVHDVGAGMDVAHDALAAGNGKRELVVDRMAGTILGNGRVRRKACAAIAEAGIRPRMDRRTIVGINHVASAAAARSVVARVVVGSQKIQRRIEQAGLLQPEKNRVRAVGRAQTAIAQPRAGPAGIFFGFRNARFRAKPSAALENSKDVAGLGNLELRQRVEIGQHSLAGPFPRPTAAEHSESSAARRSCYSSRHTRGHLFGTAPLLYSAAPQSMQP